MKDEEGVTEDSLTKATMTTMDTTMVEMVAITMSKKKNTASRIMMEIAEEAKNIGMR